MTPELKPLWSRLYHTQVCKVLWAQPAHFHLKLSMGRETDERTGTYLAVPVWRGFPALEGTSSHRENPQIQTKGWVKTSLQKSPYWLFLKRSCHQAGLAPLVQESLLQSCSPRGRPPPGQHSRPRRYPSAPLKWQPLHTETYKWVEGKSYLHWLRVFYFPAFSPLTSTLPNQKPKLFDHSFIHLTIITKHLPHVRHCSRNW